MNTNATRHNLFSIIALLSFNKVGCSNLRLAKDLTQELPQTNEWKILKQLLNSRCPIENCRVFSYRLILLCTAVFFNVFVAPKQEICESYHRGTNHDADITFFNEPNRYSPKE